MTITSRITLKSVFESGDTIEQDSMENLIDSYLHLSDTSAQTITSPVIFTGSATFNNINAADIDVSSINASVLTLGTLITSAFRATIVSANQISVDYLEVSATANFKDISCSGINAALVAAGRITVSGISAFSVWANRAELASARIVNLSFAGATETTAVASAGGAGEIPASADGFIVVQINGVQKRIPFFDT